MKTTSDLKIGKPVYVYGRSEYMTTTGNVSKITPTGLVDVTLANGKTIRFNKHGYSIGTPEYDERYIDLKTPFEERKARIESLSRANLALVSVSNSCVTLRVGGAR